MLLMVACGKTTDPVEEVRHYATHFADKVSAGQLDSVEVSYPEIAQADSIVSIQSDSIVVTETPPGSFDVTFVPNVTLKVSRAEDGSVKVTESYGLFAFPDSKIEIAKKTGMWKKDLTDVQLAEKMRDPDFFEMINDKVKKASSDIISVGRSLY